MADDAGPQARETVKERIDRELIELLNELRVALPGVQVLLGFLLTVPFQGRFADATPFEQDVYFATLLATAVSSMLLMTPAAQHRILFRQKEKEQMLRRANGYAIAGFVVLGLALAGVLLLVTHFLFGPGRATVTVAVASIGMAWAWLAQPLIRRARTVQDDPHASAGAAPE